MSEADCIILYIQCYLTYSTCCIHVVYMLYIGLEETRTCGLNKVTDQSEMAGTCTRVSWLAVEKYVYYGVYVCEVKCMLKNA